MMQEAALGELQQVKSSSAEVLLFDKRGVVGLGWGSRVQPSLLQPHAQTFAKTSRSTLEAGEDLGWSPGLVQVRIKSFSLKMEGSRGPTEGHS